METVQLTEVKRYQNTSKSTGKAYTSLRIKTAQHGDTMLSGFDSTETKEWKEGDSVEITVKPNGQYMNFEVQKKPRSNGGGVSTEQYERIMVKLDTILTEVRMIRGGTKVAAPVETSRPEQEDPSEEQEGEDDALANIPW